ncbi:MAG: hypothetical protein H6744_00520 [Deltaproteobacteria bacterium]|nr:hypothetical protein [Deltaproteobacteria bacterium]MCB9785149.1 hypothetical protein [Deltaproteobacteria bacterium]
MPTIEETIAAAVAQHDTLAILRLATDDTARGKIIDAVNTAASPATCGFFLGSISSTAGSWVAAMTDARFERFMGNAANIADAIQYNAVWTLYNDPGTRSAAIARAVWAKLFTAQILSPGATSVTWPGGTSTSTDGSTSWEWRTLYMPVAPADLTMQRLMVGIRPLPRGHINMANIAFVNQTQQQYRQTVPSVGAWTNHGATGTIGTSYYLDNCQTVVIVSDAAGGTTNDFAMGTSGSGVGGVTGGPALTWFLNHARHEVGHAVGARSLAGVPETGNAFATTYGGWAASSESAFKAAMWTATDTQKLNIAGVETDVAATAARDWLTGAISGGAEPSGNAITALAGTFDQKLAAIRLAWASQELTKYFGAVYGRVGLAGFKDGGYQFPGYTPGGAKVHLWASRMNPAGFTTYDKTAFDACVGRIGWYALSSPVEMFAEMYTQKYSSGALPPAVNGKDPSTFFPLLESSTDASVVPTDEASGRAPSHTPATPVAPAATPPSHTLPS